MTVVKFNQNYPLDLLAMRPPQFDAPDSISEVPLPDNTSHAFDPDDINKKDLWSQRLINLKDIPVELWWQSAGKSLIVNRSGEPSVDNYNIEFAFPDKLETPRDFSISGDGTAAAVSFDGTANVELSLSNVTATKLKNARNFSLAGDIIAAEVSFDATGDLVLQTQYQNIVPDDKLPSWINENFEAINIDIANLITNMALKMHVVGSGANITLNASHKFNYVRFTSAGSVTVPPGVFVVDDVIYIRAGNGQVVINAGAGVTIHRPYGQDNVLPGTGATAALVCVATGQFDLIGTTRYV